MNTFTKTAAGAVLGGSLLVAGGFGLANAAPEAPAPEPQAPQSAGALNVGLTVNGEQIGTIQDVSVSTAQTLATSVCPGDDLAAKLPQLASNEISTVPVCASGVSGVSYTFSHAGPGNSEVPQGQGHGNGSIGSATTTATPAPAPAGPSADGSMSAEG